MFMPFNVVGIWFRGLFSLLLLGGAIYLLTQWYRQLETVVIEPVKVSPVNEPWADDPEPQVAARRQTVRRWQFGLNQGTGLLVGGTMLLGWSLLGSWIGSPRFLRRRGIDEPKDEQVGETQSLLMPDGSMVRVQIFGPVDGNPVVLTHGWGLNGSEWYYTRKTLSAENRVFTWDLPGLGESERPPDRDWSLEQLARTLDVVVAATGNKPVLLVGHSIGVMITLTYCKLFPQALGSRVRGLVLAHGTYTNPVKTMSMAGLYTALQKPVLEPLCHLMVWLSPVCRILNWMSYLNGSAHQSTERGSFSGQETRGQLDFISRSYCKAAPDVVAKGMLAMLQYDATAVLGRIPIPTLVVTGDKDRVCLPEASRHMADSIPNAAILVLPKAKHCGFFEFHESFDQALTDFLASLKFHGVESDLGRTAYPSPATETLQDSIRKVL